MQNKYNNFLIFSQNLTVLKWATRTQICIYCTLFLQDIVNNIYFLCLIKRYVSVTSLTEHVVYFSIYIQPYWFEIYKSTIGFVIWILVQHFLLRDRLLPRNPTIQNTLYSDKHQLKNTEKNFQMANGRRVQIQKTASVQFF